MTDSLNKRLTNSALPAFMQSREGWSRMLELKRITEPHIHQIEPTNACPYTCIMCPRTEKMTRPIGFMTMDLFAKTIDEIRTYSAETLAKEVELFHFGESLLHPQIIEMTDYAGKAGIKAVLSVKAPEITKDKAEALFNTGAYKIIISLDGYDNASYSKIGGSRADYDKAVKNITDVVMLHNQIKCKTILSVRMIVINDTVSQVKKFKTLWEQKGVTVELREFFPWGEKEMVKLGKFDKYPPFMPCPFPWKYVVVQWNGDVVACCRDYNGVNIMGNVMDDSLKEIWNGQAYRQFRYAMEKGNYTNPICTSCMDIYYTTGA